MISTRVGRLAVGVWVAAFVGLFGTYVLNTVDGLRVPAQLLFGVPLAGWAAFRLRGPRDVLDVAVLVGVGVHLTVALAGVDPAGSLEATGLALGLAILFWLMRRLRIGSENREAVAAAVAVPAVIWLVAVGVAWIAEKVAWVTDGGGLPALESYQVFVWGTSNAFPVLALLSAPFLAFMAPGPFRRRLAIALGVATVVVVPFSVGRAGWLGIATALLAFESISGWPRIRLGWSRIQKSRSLALAAAAIGAAVLIVLALNAGRAAGAIVATLDTRVRIWQQGLGVFATDPMTGSGPGTFSWIRLEHVPDHSDPIGVILAHNAWLQTLTDGGLLLGLAFGVVAVLWVVRAWSGRRVMTTAQRLAASSVVGLAVASLLDDFSFLPALMAMAVTLAAWATPAATERAHGPTERPWLLIGALVVLAIILLPAVSVERARLAASAGRAAAMAGRWHDAADRFAAAASEHESNPLHHLSLGLAYAELDEPSAARAAYERAAALSPGDPRASGALAALATVANDATGAIAYLETASRVSTDAQYAFRLSAARNGVGDVPEAAEAYALAIVLRTDLYRLLSGEVLGLSRGDVLTALPGVAASVDAADPNRARRVAWDIALADGFVPDDAPPAWRAVAAAAEGDAEAAALHLRAARHTAPHDQVSHLAGAAVARLACDEAEYRTAMRLAGRVLGGPVPALAISRDPIYRDSGLGDYQPSWVERPPAPPVWPFGLVTPPECEWKP